MHVSTELPFENETKGIGCVTWHCILHLQPSALVLSCDLAA